MSRINRTELFECFKTEASERLQRLNDGVLLLEKGQNDDSVLDALFREAHTLKGAAGMIGCEEICAIAHGFEDVLGGIKTGGVDPALAAGVLFRSCDAIKELLETEGGRQCPGLDVEGLLGKLSDLSGKERRRGRGTQNSGIDNGGPERPGKAGASSRRGDETIRVSIDKLDNLANTVGELVISRVKLAGNVDVLRQVSEIVRNQNRVAGEICDYVKRNNGGDHDTRSEEIMLALNRYKESNSDLMETVLGAYGEQHDTTCRLETIIDRLDGDVTALRMRPIAAVFDVFPRIVRDLAEEYGKTVDIEIEGGDTELDRTMLEGIKDPLMHLMRNSVDHGVESPAERKEGGKPERGHIKLSASQDGYRIFVTLEDDGRGIDPERIKHAAVQKGMITAEAAGKMPYDETLRLIFIPGFSTKSAVTDISGRGVGTDVVKKYVEDNLHGQVLVESKKNEYTRFTLVLPLTLAVTPSVIVKTGGQMFAIPAHSVQLGIAVCPDELRSTDGKLAVSVIDCSVPLVKMADALALPDRAVHDVTKPFSDDNQRFEVVVVENGSRRLAFAIDEIVEEQDIVVKRLAPPLDDLEFVAGVTILEKGEVVPILNVQGLLDAGEKSGQRHAGETGSFTKAEDEPKRNILIVEDSLTTRELMKNIVRSAGYNVDAASDGLEALNIVAGKDLDLIITDIEMPRMNGFDMTQRLKEDPVTRDIPVIIVTSLFLDEEKRRGMEVGADAYIKKGDFDQTKLVETINRLVV